MSAEGISLTDDKKAKARLSFTMPDNKVSLAATYTDKVNAIAITGFEDGKNFNGNITDRPRNITYTTNVSSNPSSAPLAWDKGATTENEDGSTTTSWTASFTVANTDPGFASTVDVTGDEGWTVEKTTGASVTLQKQVSYTDTSTTEYSLKVLCYDVTIDQVVDEYDYEFIQEDLDNVGGYYQLFVGTPAVESACLYSWMEENETLSGLSEESEWSQDDALYAIVAGNAAEGATVVFPQNKTNAVVVAKYVPSINEIDVDVDEPVAGQALPNEVSSVLVTSSQTYGSLPISTQSDGATTSNDYVDLATMLDLTWSNAQGDTVAANEVAQYDTTYTATIRLKETYQGKVRFVIDPDADIQVNTTQIAFEELGLGEQTTSFAEMTIQAHFTTDKIKLLSVSAPTDLTVSSSDMNSWPLPPTVPIITEEGTEQAPVTWNMAGITLLESSPADTAKVEVYSIPGSVSLPGSVDANGCSLEVDLVVRNNQTIPVSAAPASSLQPGTYYAKQQLKLSAVQDADIFYTLDGDEPIDGHLYSDAEGIVLAGEAGKSIAYTVRAMAVEGGELPSQVVEFAYTVELSATVDKNSLVDAIAAAKKAEDGVKTSPDGKDVLVSQRYTTATERKALDDAIAAAQKVADNPDATQGDVDGALAAVKAATNAFNKAKKAGKKLSFGPGEDPNQMGKDGTALGKGASAAAADKAITSMKNDKDPAGARALSLKLRSTKQATRSVKVQWNKASGAKTYVLYGNRCGKRYKMVKLATTKKASFTVKTINGKKLKKSTYHKFIVVALDKNNNVVSTSKVIHVSTKGSNKKANPTKVTVTSKVVKKAKKLKRGKSLKLGAKIVSPRNSKVAKHVALRYESSNPAVATVSGKGVVKAKSKGKAKIVAYAQNGVSRTVTVVVK